MKCYDIIIVGGGLAGLTAALHLSRKNHKVLLIEKNSYPHHRVCGEYVSNEVLPYIKRLGVSFNSLDTKSIDTFQLSTSDGKFVKSKLPLGGIGISRYAFDHLLYKNALDSGVTFRFLTVTTIVYRKDIFEVATAHGETFNAALVLGAYGKRSSIDKGLDRAFIHKKSPWLGVKSHYRYDDFPDNLVALHNFNGGYAGLSKTETGAVNFCYLASYASFQLERNIEDFNTNVISKNPFLSEFLRKAVPIFEEPLTIAQISFHQKKAVYNHILMCGDSAGLIHPLCGNGMAMAIHSAKIASELICDYLATKDQNLPKLEYEYQRLWNHNFGRRLWTGRQLQSILLNPNRASMAMKVAMKSPSLLRQLIKRTHGKEL